MKRLLLPALLALGYASAANAASTLRCNGKLIKVGLPAAYVLAVCGEPENQTFQESVMRAGTASGHSRVVGIALSEHWIYDRGWGRFPAVLTFSDGTLKRIEFMPHRSEKSARLY